MTISLLPGEQLIIKMWESIVDKGIAGMLQPWQARRVGQAAAEVKRDEMLALAQAERDAEAIRRGEKLFIENRLLTNTETSGRVPITVALAQPAEVASLAARTLLANEMHRQVALARAVVHAENELAEDASSRPDVDIDDDWLLRWRDYASNVASQSLQALWGKVLAGEVKSPGRFSFRTLDCVKNLTKTEARLIERVAPFVINDAIFKIGKKYIDDYGVSYGELLELQTIGILYGVDSTTLAITLRSTEINQFTVVMRCHNAALLVTTTDAKKEFSLFACGVTKMGQEVMTLASGAANLERLKALGESIKATGYNVAIGDCQMLALGKVQLGALTSL